MPNLCEMRYPAEGDGDGSVYRYIYNMVWYGRKVKLAAHFHEYNETNLQNFKVHSHRILNHTYPVIGHALGVLSQINIDGNNGRRNGDK